MEAIIGMICATIIIVAFMALVGFIIWAMAKY